MAFADNKIAEKRFESFGHLEAVKDKPRRRVPGSASVDGAPILATRPGGEGGDATVFLRVPSQHPAARLCDYGLNVCPRNLVGV